MDSPFRHALNLSLIHISMCIRDSKYVVVYDSAGDRVPDEFRKQEPADALAQTPVPMLKMQKMIGAVTNQENKKKP